jgi:hypothetical protein
MYSGTFRTVILLVHTYDEDDDYEEGSFGARPFSVLCFVALGARIGLEMNCARTSFTGANSWHVMVSALGVSNSYCCKYAYMLGLTLRRDIDEINQY